MIKLKDLLNEGSKVHFEKKLKDGKIFQVIDRDTTGMRGTQDEFRMQIVDKSGKVIKDLGSHPSVKGAEKFGDKFEAVNEAAMNPVKKVVNAILKKHNIQAMKTYASSVGGAHNMTRGGYRWEGDYFLGFYGKVSQDDIEKVGADMKRAGVEVTSIKDGMISGNFSKTGLQ